MKISIITTAALLFFCNIVSGQKAVLTNTSFKTWTTVDGGTLSNNGEFVTYNIRNEPLGGVTCIIKATNHKWQYRAENYSDMHFSLDSKYMFAQSGDTLVQVRLNSNEVIKIPNFKAYYLLHDNIHEWLIYQIKDSNATIVKNLQDNSIINIPEVKRLMINEAACTLMFTTTESNVETLSILDPKQKNLKKIYRGEATTNHIFDQKGTKLAFTTNSNDIMSIWYYDSNSSGATVIADDKSNGIANDLKINLTDIWQFSNDGEDLFFNLVKRLDKTGNRKPDPLVWNYKDSFLRSSILAEGQLRGENLTVFHVKERKVMQLLSGHQKLAAGGLGAKKNDVLIVECSYGEISEMSWNVGSRPSYYLCFSKAGKTVLIKEHSNITNAKTSISISPSNNFLVYFDPDLRCFVSYNVKTTSTQIIGTPVDVDLLKYSPTGNAVIEAWIDNTEKVIVRSNFDLWLLDASNKEKPYNLTEGSGLKDSIAFALGEPRRYGIFSPDKNILISGLNKISKEYGIYSLNINTKKIQTIWKGKNWFGEAYNLIPAPTSYFKAKDVNRYLLRFETVNQSPNFVYTDDFKKFVPISSNYPEKKYNWLSSELIKYKDKLGNNCEAILYKPDDFDASKKYPVIFNYYLLKSDELYRHLYPEPNVVGVNIPLLVSNGYIVCVPNIYQKVGTVAEAALIGLNAAADYLAQYKWVDTSKMAITGHSLGGYETNYIITQTNRFAAAFSGAGPSNLIDAYNKTMASGGSADSYVVGGGYNMGKGLPEIPEKYILNTPILYAKNIVTPLLLLHNDEDRNVSVDQSLQLFIQLRRLQRPTWLLQYKGEKHVLRNEPNQLDCQEKVLSFFNYYLKGKTKPDWMNNPIK